MTPTQAGRPSRTEAKQATRAALLEAGLRETIERGGEIPSMEKLCARAGYTRGAFYVHFRDRDHFVEELLDWVLHDIVQSLFQAVPDGVTDVRAVVARFTNTLSAGEWPDVHRDIRSGYLAVLRELRPGNGVQVRHAELMRGIADRLTDGVRQGQADGTIRADIAPASLAMLLLLSAVGSIVWSDLGIVRRSEDLSGTLLALMRADPPPG